MISRLKLLAAGASALAVISGCAQVGLGGQAACRTIYVYVPGADGSSGAVAPVTHCPDVPRESLDADAALAMGPETISSQAAATRPKGAQATYNNPNEMIEAADMAAFMERIRADYVAEENAAAWGYVVVDALASGQVVLAQDVIDLMEDEPAPQFMSANHLKPWTLAFAGRLDAAEREMGKLNGALNPPTLVGHLALLSEGTGDVEAALERYATVTETFHPPDKEAAGTPAYVSQVLAFNGQRMLALRQAALLRALDRDDEAVELLDRLASATENDGYVEKQLEDAREGDNRPKVRTLKQAMARAIGDEAGAIEERQAIVGMMSGRTTSPPFNYLTSSMRQSALVLDPDNTEIRLTESGTLYGEGKFAAALRLALGRTLVLF